MSDGRRPVLVIHGVGNRGSEGGFEETVQRFQSKFEDTLRLIPVFWGDLAPDPSLLAAAVPRMGEEVRDGSISNDVDRGIGLALINDEGHEVRKDGGARIVADAAAGAEEVRAGGVGQDDVRRSVEATWPELRWLPYIRNEQVLVDVGRVVGEVAGQVQPVAGDRFEVRDGIEVRGLSDLVKGLLGKVDDLVGNIIGNAGGRLNQELRARFAPKFAGFFGDIFDYLYDSEAIHHRVWERIEKHAPGWGTAEQPFGAVAHSLGGVILFDLAVSETRPLHLDGFVTFGSQSPFFHTITDRGARIDEFKGKPVMLPLTIKGEWINLWEPLDMLAFVASRVFCFADGSSPMDRMVPHENSSGLWTHTSYWDLAILPEAMTEAFVG